MGIPKKKINILSLTKAFIISTLKLHRIVNIQKRNCSVRVDELVCCQMNPKLVFYIKILWSNYSILMRGATKQNTLCPMIHYQQFLILFYLLFFSFFHKNEVKRKKFVFIVWQHKTSISIYVRIRTCKIYFIYHAVYVLSFYM